MCEHTTGEVNSFIACQHAYDIKSVHHPVKFMYYIEMNVYIVKLFLPSARGMTSFIRPAAVTKLQRKLPQHIYIYKGSEKFEMFHRNRRLPWKRHDIGPQLLWNTNWKSYIPDWLVLVSMTMTLSDLERRDASGQNFLANFHNYSQMVWPTATKFGKITHVGQ